MPDNDNQPQSKRELRFCISELEIALFEAVKVAYERGAHEWVRIRHPKLYVIIKETE